MSERLKPTKNKKYLAYIGNKDCQVTGTSFEHCVVHHVTINAGRGISQKASDYRCISIRADLHMELHHKSESLFWQELDMNPFELVVANLEEWIGAM